MRKTKEILRLALNEGLSQREIAISTGVGKTTIQELLAKVKKGQNWLGTGVELKGESMRRKKVVDLDQDKQIQQ